MAAFDHGHQQTGCDYDSLDDLSRIYVVTPSQHLPRGFELKLSKKLPNNKEQSLDESPDGDNIDVNSISNLPVTLTQSQSDCETSGQRHNPPSLLTLCVRFVAININLVDSLVDFPEVVGKSLFDAVVASGSVDKPSSSASTILQLFTDAYQEAVLDKLSFKGVHQVITPNLELWQSFSYLKKLDVADCKLGDHHELLSSIGQMTR